MAAATPLDGFDEIEVSKTKAGPASNDMYGKLYCYLQSLFRSFYRSLGRLNVDFQGFNVDARQLPGYLKGQESARIEVSGEPSLRTKLANQVEASNISNYYYLDPGATVRLLAPLLEKPSANPYATLINLFMNAVHEIGKTLHNRGDEKFSQTLRNEFGRVAEHLGLQNPPQPKDPRRTLITHGLGCVRDGDPFFEK